MKIIFINIFLIILAFGFGFLGLMSSNSFVTIGCSFLALIIVSQLPEPQNYRKEDK